MDFKNKMNIKPYIKHNEIFNKLFTLKKQLQFNNIIYT